MKDPWMWMMMRRFGTDVKERMTESYLADVVINCFGVLY